ncbi:DNA-binding MarR family transcriptional regulator [Salibacterium salarium]|uniref:MarR family winged helix-turn-helix transcriptional regulator n=1 Tax=Salibacterium salarium TaxID=284579 RepID=UPI00277EB105|nr:MarR family transcriptional regulator [Salibacterium salarium]MDQ0299975.1 DNA-binding MarR family transcriptional regulator [Salibacterium salarium]
MSLDDYKKIYLQSIYSLENIAKYLQPKVPLLSELQLTSRQETIMILFMRHNSITLGEVSERIGISKSAISQAMNKLEKEDLLIRSINEQNRREVTITFGEKGKELKRQFEAFETSIIEDYISQLKLEDMQHVQNVLVQLEKTIREGEINGKDKYGKDD